MKVTKIITTIAVTLGLCACAQFGTLKSSDVHNIYFGSGSSMLSDKGLEAIKRAALSTKGAKMYDIKIAGFADNLGDHRQNKELSKKRVLAVQKALLDMGLDPRSIKVSFHGEGLAPKKGALSERRVEIWIRKSS